MILLIEIVVENNVITSCTGHAKYAEYGSDIVCAGVSAIIKNYELYDNPSEDITRFVIFSLKNIAETYPSNVSVVIK